MRWSRTTSTPIRTTAAFRSPPNTSSPSTPGSPTIPAARLQHHLQAARSDRVPPGLPIRASRAPSSRTPTGRRGGAACTTRPVRESVLQAAAATARLPLVIGFTALGAGVVIGRQFLGVLSRLLPLVGTGRPTPRHHAGRVREQAGAAAQAAHAAGVLKRPS